MSSSSVNDELTNLNSVANKIHAGRYGNTSEKAILQQMIAMGNIDKMIDSLERLLEKVHAGTYG